MFDLRSWLRRAPKPSSLRIHTGDGEERIIDLGSKRFRWNDCEQTVRASGATNIEALDKDGKILRAVKLTDEEVGSDSDEEARGKYDDKLLTRQAQAQAAMLDRYGARMSEAFLAGAKAASSSQEKLVELVEVLTAHLGVAITNLHNVSVNLANAMQANVEGQGGDANGAMLAGLLTKVLGGGVAVAPPNGGKAKSP